MKNLEEFKKQWGTDSPSLIIERLCQLVTDHAPGSYAHVLAREGRTLAEDLKSALRGES